MVSRIPIQIEPESENKAYLETKRARLNHWIHVDPNPTPPIRPPPVINDVLKATEARLSVSAPADRPFVTLAYAQSLDGSIATADGRPLALSSQPSLFRTHALRARHDGLLIGIGTVLSDDPRLTVRHTPGPNPQPLILDTGLRTPRPARLLNHPRSPWFLAGAPVDPARRAPLRAAGAQVFEIAHDPHGRVDLAQALLAVRGRGIASVMVEGGARVLRSFLEANLVDWVIITLAPVFIGGKPALPPGETTLPKIRLLGSGSLRPRPDRLGRTRVTRALIFSQPRQVRIVDEPAAEPGRGEVLVQTRVSGISAGSELLVYRGEAPADLPADVLLPALAGRLDFPLKYGYAAAGHVASVGPEVDPSVVGRAVFGFHPHQTHFVAALEELLLLPDGLALEQSVLLPNMETAVGLVHDGRPLAGEDVAVFGQGIVGLLTTALLGRMPLGRLVTFDNHSLRRRASLDLGARDSHDPANRETQAGLLRPFGEAGADLCFELTGEPHGARPGDRLRRIRRAASSSGRGTGTNRPCSTWAAGFTEAASR